MNYTEDLNVSEATRLSSSKRIKFERLISDFLHKTSINGSLKCIGMRSKYVGLIYLSLLK